MPQIRGVIILTSSRTRAKLSSSQKKDPDIFVSENNNKMATKDRRAIYTNPSAQYWVSKEEAPVDIVGKFHQSLPDFPGQCTTLVNARLSTPKIYQKRHFQSFISQQQQAYLP
jgi:hypothetical protein